MCLYSIFQHVREFVLWKCLVCSMPDSHGWFWVCWGESLSLCCWSEGAVCKTVCSAVRVTEGTFELSVQSREQRPYHVLLLSSASRGQILLFLEKGERTRIDYTYTLTHTHIRILSHCQICVRSISLSHTLTFRQLKQMKRCFFFQPIKHSSWILCSVCGQWF